MSVIKITSVNNIDFNQYTSEDLIAWDLDDTVFIQEFKIFRYPNREILNQIAFDMSEVERSNLKSYLFNNQKFHLIEPDIINIIAKLTVLNINTIGFTSRHTGLYNNYPESNANVTLKIVNQLGIKFSSNEFIDLEMKHVNHSNPDYKDYIINDKSSAYYSSSNVMMKDDVLFSNNINKGIIFIELLKRSQFRPKIFVLIDNDQNTHTDMVNIIKLANFVLGWNIVYHGYHYTGAIDLLDNEVDLETSKLELGDLLKTI